MPRLILSSTFAIIFTMALHACSSQPSSRDIAMERSPAAEPKASEMSEAELAIHIREQAELAQQMHDLEIRFKTASTNSLKLAVFEEALTKLPRESINSRSVSYFQGWLSDEQFRAEALNNAALMQVIETYISEHAGEFSGRHLAITYGQLVASRPPLHRGMALVESLLSTPQNAELGMIIMRSASNASKTTLAPYFDSPTITQAFYRILETPEMSPAKRRLIALLTDSLAEGYGGHPFFKASATQNLLKKAQKIAARQQVDRLPGTFRSVLGESCKLLVHYASSFARSFTPAR